MLHLSTVYRTLRWLEEQALVTPRWFEEERRQERFDANPDELHGDHYHFRCEICKQIVEFSDARVEEIKRSFAAATGADVAQANLVLYGTCAACRADEAVR